MDMDALQHRRSTRVLRGAIAAGAATVIAALSHTVGGDAPPSAFGVLASLVLSVPVCTALVGRARSWWRLAASVAGSQVLFHALFAGPAVAVVADGHHAGHALPAVHHADDRMLLAHVIAGVLTLLALGFGERAFHAAMDSARLRLGRALAWAAPVGLPRRRTVAPAARTLVLPRDAAERRIVPLRGPPLRLATR